VLFGALALLLAALICRGAGLRPPLRETALEALGAVLLSVVLAAPYLYHAARYSNPVSSISGV